MIKIKKRFIVIIFVVLYVYACYPPESEISDFSRKWKMSSPQERGSFVRPDLCYKYLKNKDTEAVLEFLGPPDIVQDDAYLYNLGDMGGLYDWTLWVVFSDEGKVIKVFGDD